MELKMNWVPSGILLKYVLKACSEDEEKQSARFRCRICWTNNHTTEEHLHPELSAQRRAELRKCQIAVPFLLAALVGIPAYFLRGGWFETVVFWLVGWPFWSWALAHRFRREQREENERVYELQG
jgi:hypothetical protein